MRIALFLALCGSVAGVAAGEINPPYRTDFANQTLLWYQLKPGVFPPYGSEHRIAGELFEVDFVHRSGRFRRDGIGEVMEFTLLPYGSVGCLNTYGDLRDLPLGTRMTFLLYQDENGAFTKAVSLLDDFSLLAGQELNYRLVSLKVDQGKILVSRSKLTGRQPPSPLIELRVDKTTRVWKGEKQAKLLDLAVGDDLLVNRTGEFPGRPSRCTDVWVGTETHKLVAETQRKTHHAFLKTRGLPAWIDRVEGKKLVLTFFSADETGLKAMFKEAGVVPKQWADEHRTLSAVAANEELRTYNPPTDQQQSQVLETRANASPGCYGCSGDRWTIEPRLLIEGFRQGRMIRIFFPGWPIKDMPFGESVYDELYTAEAIETDPHHYPFRTDFANKQSPWHRLKPGEFPPDHSEHRVAGELIKIDAVHRSGQFRSDAGELVKFTVPPFGAAMYLNAEAELQDLPLGSRYLFFLYQDAAGAFTKAALVLDEFTQRTNERFTYRLDAARLDEGKLLVAKRIPPVMNELGQLVQPPDLGRGELAVDGKTLVRKGGKQVRLSDLAVGDVLLFNLSGRNAQGWSRCTEIWAGEETHKSAAEQQRAKHNAFIKERGMPGWIDEVQGKELTITFFAASRKDFPSLLNGDPWGRPVRVFVADDELNPSGRVSQLGFRNHLPEGETAGAYGCSGTRWVLEAEKPSNSFRKGQIVRVFKEEWPIKRRAGDGSPRSP